MDTIITYIGAFLKKIINIHCHLQCSCIEGCSSKCFMNEDDNEQCKIDNKNLKKENERLRDKYDESILEFIEKTEEYG